MLLEFWAGDLVNPFSEVSLSLQSIFRIHELGVIIGLTPFRVLITLLRTYLLSPLGLQVGVK